MDLRTVLLTHPQGMISLLNDATVQPEQQVDTFSSERHAGAFRYPEATQRGEEEEEEEDLSYLTALCVRCLLFWLCDG